MWTMIHMRLYSEQCVTRTLCNAWKWWHLRNHFEQSGKRMLHDLTESTVPKVPRRALLYVPGDNMKMITKARQLNVDCVCLDLEDGVAITAKDKARSTVLSVLETNPDFGYSELAVRINSISSGLADKDLDALFTSRQSPKTICLPKLDNTEEVKWLMSKLRSLALRDELQVITQVETAEGLINLVEVFKLLNQGLSSVKAEHVAVIFGSDDFCASIGATRSPQGSELMYARQKTVTVAKAFRTQAIDMVHIDYKDLSGLRKYSMEGAAMGFTGKQVIHPSQIDVVQECFLPSEDKVKWASELITAFEQHKQQGKGAFVFRNQMIDKPSLLQAQNIKNMINMVQRRQREK